MSFTDMIKKSVLEGFTSADLSTTAIAVALGISIILGLYIYMVYRLACRSGFYNRNFNKSLATMPVITTGIMLAMQSNLVISLGMVGALSIVRFRNAVKDASDLTYLFWSISIGIIVGAGLYELAFILSIFLSVLLFALDLLPSFRAPCLLVVSAESDSVEKQLLSCIQEHARRVKIRSKNMTKHGTEWIFELHAKDSSALTQSVIAVDSVSSVNLLSHDGDLRV